MERRQLTGRDIQIMQIPSHLENVSISVFDRLKSDVRKFFVNIFLNIDKFNGCLILWGDVILASEVSVLLLKEARRRGKSCRYMFMDDIEREFEDFDDTEIDLIVLNVNEDIDAFKNVEMMLRKRLVHGLGTILILPGSVEYFKKYDKYVIPVRIEERKEKKERR